MSGAAKNIGIDALPILADFERGGGISKFIRGLLERVLGSTPGYNYTLYARGRSSRDRLRELERFAAGRASVKNTLLPDRLQEFCWGYERLSGALEKKLYKGLDLFVSAAYFTPRLRDARVASFIYDLTPWKSSRISAEHRSTFGKLLDRTVARSSFFIAISESTKRDLMEAYGVPAGKIGVVYPFAADVFRPAPETDIRTLLAGYGIEGEYILYTGIRSENKNLMTLLKAFKGISATVGHKLVLAGRSDFSSETDEKIKKFVRDRQLTDRVIILDYLPQSELPILYSGASVFVFPSFYEGFGLPVLESMACGVPVVTSNTSSLPEVVGDAGIMVDPDDQSGMGEGMLRIINDGALRSALIEKGFERVRKFDPLKSVSEFISVLEKVA